MTAWSFSRVRIMREARDAVIAQRLNGAPEQPCPYRARSQSRVLWDLAARRTNDLVDKLERIGA